VPTTQPATFPGYFFLDRQRRVPVFFPESLRGFLLALSDLATIDHDIVILRYVVDLKRAEREGVEMHWPPPPPL
jgi:hypothetical protein